MENTYCLQIVTEERFDISLIDNVLDVKHNTIYGWELEVEAGSATIDYINFFLNILDGKYEALEQIGVTRDMIIIWHYYEYDSQCNLKYSPLDLKRLGDNEVKLCVSCWDSGEESQTRKIDKDEILN